jgi:hypothetical protein
MIRCGADLPDDPADVASQLVGDVQRAVGVAEEPDVVDADLGSRGALLGLADGRDAIPRYGWVEATCVTVGDDAVGDDAPGRGPVGDRAGGAEVDVVGMGGDDEGAFDLVRIHVPDHAAPLRAGRTG